MGEDKKKAGSYQTGSDSRGNENSQKEVSMRDAPHIEEAEREGMPHPAKISCPVCRIETDELFVMGYDHSEVVGCPSCLRRISVDEHLERRGED